MQMSQSFYSWQLPITRWLLISLYYKQPQDELIVMSYNEVWAKLQVSLVTQ